MSFKHVKFEDSPIMRSLEKVAREKGLVKPEPPLQKTATLSKKADLTPTPNLMENIFKLCAGLREQGRVVEASEVETNYLHYKQAQTLYEAHKEKGEDVINFAHPKGSHKLEGVAGDEATFEDILDQHAKILEKIQKKPTGKLSSAAQILNSVKRALGQDRGTLSNTVTQNMAIVNARMSRIASLSSELTVPITPYSTLVQQLTENPTIDNLKKLQGTFNDLHSRLDPSGSFHYLTFGAGGLSEDTWVGVQALLTDAQRAISNALAARQELKRQESISEVSPPPAISGGPSSGVANTTEGLSLQFNALAQKIELYKSQAESAGSPNSEAIVAWLDKASALLKKYSDAYADNKFKSDPKVTQNFNTKLNDIQTKVDALAQKYIK